MRKIGHVYTDDEIAAMDDKFIADMAEADAMPKPADTPYDSHDTGHPLETIEIQELIMDELYTAFDAIEDAATVITRRLEAYNAPNSDYDKAERLFYKYLKNFVETYN